MIILSKNTHFISTYVLNLSCFHMAYTVSFLHFHHTQELATVGVLGVLDRPDLPNSCLHKVVSNTAGLNQAFHFFWSIIITQLSVNSLRKCSEVFWRPSHRMVKNCYKNEENNCIWGFLEAILVLSCHQ